VAEIEMHLFIGKLIAILSLAAHIKSNVVECV
jgi:hypothetical protein